MRARTQADHARDAGYMVAADVVIARGLGLTQSREMVEQAQQLVALMLQSPVFTNMTMRQFVGADYRYEVHIGTGVVAIQQTGERWSRCFYPRVGVHSTRLSLNKAEFLRQLIDL